MPAPRGKTVVGLLGDMRVESLELGVNYAQFRLFTSCRLVLSLWSIFQNGRKSDKKHKNTKKICVFQKKAVLLQPICAESLAI